MQSARQQVCSTPQQGYGPADGRAHQCWTMLHTWIAGKSGSHLKPRGSGFDQEGNTCAWSWLMHAAVLCRWEAAHRAHLTVRAMQQRRGTISAVRSLRLGILRLGSRAQQCLQSRLGGSNARSVHDVADNGQTAFKPSWPAEHATATDRPELSCGSCFCCNSFCVTGCMALDEPALLSKASCPASQLHVPFHISIALDHPSKKVLPGDLFQRRFNGPPYTL